MLSLKDAFEINEADVATSPVILVICLVMGLTALLLRITTRSMSSSAGYQVYTFGHGLSYTQFNTTLVKGPTPVNVKLSSNQHCHSLPTKPDASPNPCPSVLVDDLSNTISGTIDFEVLVKKVGARDARDGKPVLIVYAEPPEQYTGLPFKQVVGFERVALKVGESKSVKFELDVAKSLSVVTNTAHVSLPSGKHNVHVQGDCFVMFPVDEEFSY
ncbi:hypothetical protein MRB53_032053 [Persea americana]|uniref:Uncharacterized protein n=1 Tax=Persea americana TaxID=3435 RepID=A0ACC2KQQ4_PERAE|nr:hypothetical protein MRB53_032053 [Persea americana]